MKNNVMMNSTSLFGQISDRTYSTFAASVRTIEAKGNAIREGQVPATYTERLLADQNARVKKLGSEVMELIREDSIPQPSLRPFVEEAADTVYSVEVILAARGVSIAKTLSALALYWDNAVRTMPAERERIADMLTDQELRAKQLSSAAGFLVVAECSPEFEQQSLVIGAMGVLNVTGVMMQARGINMAPVFAELGARNTSPMQGDTNA